MNLDLIRKIRSKARFARSLGLSNVVISAGMPRSGSTLLFNILRELMDQGHSYEKVWSGWIGDFRNLRGYNAYLIKTHRVDRFLKLRANKIFYSFRDMRSAAVSGHRMFKKGPIRMNFFESAVSEYKVAKDSGAVMVKYEDLRDNPRFFIRKCAEELKTDADFEAVHNACVSLRPPDNKERDVGKTLLHKNHMTGTSDSDWRSEIPRELLDCIHEKYGWWFKDNGYEIP